MRKVNHFACGQGAEKYVVDPVAGTATCRLAVALAGVATWQRMGAPRSQVHPDAVAEFR